MEDLILACRDVFNICLNQKIITLERQMRMRKKLLKDIISGLMTVAITGFPVYDRTPGLAVWVTYE